MSELEYYAGEFTDSDLDALAEAGDYYLDGSGFFLVPTQDEMQVLAKMGSTLLFLERVWSFWSAIYTSLERESALAEAD